jgi:hypothetical protein
VGQPHVPEIAFHRARQDRQPELQEPFIRDSLSPQVGFARSTVTISRRRWTGIGGWPGRDFHGQQSYPDFRSWRVDLPESPLNSAKVPVGLHHKTGVMGGSSEPTRARAQPPSGDG